MVLLRVVSGAMAGHEIIAHQFPFRIGRSKAADLQLEMRGVWNHHCDLLHDTAEGIVLVAHAEALTLLDGRGVKREVLYNGAQIELGDAKLQFWLSPTRQTALRFREVATWMALLLLVLAEAGLAYWLPW